MESGTDIEILKKTLIKEIYEKSRNGGIGAGIGELEEITGLDKTIICYGLGKLEELGVISKYKKPERTFRLVPFGWVTKNTYTYKSVLTR